MSDVSQLASLDVAACRAQFPALARTCPRDGRPVVYLDGPGGSQVPECVIEAVAHYLRTCNANHGGAFATSEESDRLLDQAHAALGAFVGAADPDEIVFGQNMTSLTFALSRALGKTWQPGDEVVVTRLDHDANIRPWVRAAQDAGATVKWVDVRPEDCTLDLDDLRRQLGPRTRLAAIGCASNSVGTVNPVREIVERVHTAGAEVFLDAVHYAPHRLPEVKSWGCDYLACSAYKFFGPHVGILWGRRERLAELPAYKVRPAPESLPGRWMTGTQSHEAIAGALAAVRYLASLSGEPSANEAGPLRRQLELAYAKIGAHEQALSARLLAGLRELPAVRLYGLTDERRLDERVATYSFTHARHAPQELARRLGEAGLFAWHGNYYALELSERLGLEPQGMLRVGLLHYNTAEEVERLLAALRELG